MPLSDSNSRGYCQHHTKTIVTFSIRHYQLDESVALVETTLNRLLISCFGEDPNTCGWEICEHPLYPLPLETGRRYKRDAKAIGVLNKLGAW